MHIMVCRAPGTALIASALERLRRKEKVMKLPDKLYHTLKWIVMIAIPAMATAYVGLAPLWSLPEPEKISVTANIVCALLGTLLGISTAASRGEK